MFTGNTDSAYLPASWASVFIKLLVLLVWCSCTMEFDLNIEQKLLWRLAMQDESWVAAGA